MAVKLNDIFLLIYEPVWSNSCILDKPWVQNKYWSQFTIVPIHLKIIILFELIIVFIFYKIILPFPVRP